MRSGVRGLQHLLSTANHSAEPLSPLRQNNDLSETAQRSLSPSVLEDLGLCFACD